MRKNYLFILTTKLKNGQKFINSFDMYYLADETAFMLSKNTDIEEIECERFCMYEMPRKMFKYTKEGFIYE